MNAPDRIWANVTAWSEDKPLCGEWNYCDVNSFDDTEYIRADLVQALIKAAQDLDRQFCDDDLGPSALAMGKLREAYMRLK